MRCMIGAPIGLGISTLITVVISLMIGDGSFYPVVPELVADCGNEINAVVLQTVCSLLYGAAWAGASSIWEREDWSIFKQTILHLVICSAATFPTAYFMRWMPHNEVGVICYFSLFFGIYLFIWIFMYTSIKKHIQQWNRKLKKINK